MQLGGPNCKEIDKPTKTFFIFNWDKVLSVHIQEAPITWRSDPPDWLFTFEWAIFCPEERSWDFAQLGYTPLVEVNQAVIAWSFRQTGLETPEIRIKIRFLSQQQSCDLGSEHLTELKIWNVAGSLGVPNCGVTKKLPIGLSGDSGPILVVLQYQADPWQSRSKLLNSIPLQKSV